MAKKYPAIGIKKKPKMREDYLALFAEYRQLGRLILRSIIFVGMTIK